MRLATITNWAYGITVALTLTTGAAMLHASAADKQERAAVMQRYQLDQATHRLAEDILSLTGTVRQYILSGDPASLTAYRNEAKDLAAVDQNLKRLRDVGASPGELTLLRDALRQEKTLHDNQQAAIAAYQRGDKTLAQRTMFGAEYNRELENIRNKVDRFQDRLDSRTARTVADATQRSQNWRSLTEILLVATGLLFLAVLYFLFKRRVLHPVVKLSDVVVRLARQDFSIEPPDYHRIDEIGDMAHAIHIFRENGIARLRLEAERESNAAKRDLMSRMIQRMQGCDSLDDLEEVVRWFAPEIAPEMAGRFYILDSARNAMIAHCDWNNPSLSLPEFAPNACWALRRGMVHRPSGDALDVPCGHLDHADADTRPQTICVPLTAQRETVGLLCFEQRSDMTDADPTPEIYLEMLGENVSVALANLRLREALRDMALTDPLTGIANRRHLDAIIDIRLADNANHHASMSCIMLDIDHFKRFNDSFGHDVGDTVLREVATVLDNSTREVGQAFRYGGEEFLLLLPGFTAEQARERAETIRSTITELAITRDGERLGTVTASLGVATTPDHVPASKLLRAADAALYRAKESGRNRVRVAAIRQSDAA